MIEITIERGIKMKSRWGRRRKQLPDDLTETRVQWKLEEGALDRSTSYMETSCWMGLWPCAKTDYGLNDSGMGKKVW